MIPREIIVIACVIVVSAWLFYEQWHLVKIWRLHRPDDHDLTNDWRHIK